MTKTKAIAKEEEIMPVEKAAIIDSELARIIEIYKLQNPKKYELKREALLKRMELTK